MRSKIKTGRFHHFALRTLRAAFRSASLLAGLAIGLATRLVARGQTQTAAPATAPAVSPITNSVSTAGDEIIPLVVFDSVPLRDAVTALEKQAGLRVIFAPTLPNQEGCVVTVKWTQATARDTLLALLNQTGWEVSQLPGNPIFRLGARSP